MSEATISAKCPRCGAALPLAATAGLCPRCLMAEAMVPTQAGPEPAGAHPVLTPKDLAPHFPQLEILECLGRGGMGVVYRARQKSLGRFVALKLLAPERVNEAGFAERFQQEAQALAALTHPHIVTVYDFGQAGGCYFLLMEFVDGVNLRQAMKAGRFTPEQALAIVPPVCEALQYAHQHGIVHRDIKPENLLLDKEGRVKIADFGIAKMVGTEPEAPARSGGVSGEEQATPPNSLSAGTPQYMAPEQKRHRPSDHRADIYSLGVVLYELLTGELPADPLQPPSRKVQVDVRLDEIVLRALEVAPERRYQTAAEFRTQVETVVGTPASLKTPKPGTSAALKPALLTLAWHTLLLLGVLLFYVLIVPRFARMFAQLQVHLPGMTRLTIALSDSLCRGGFLLLPPLLALDGGLCFLAQSLGGRRLRQAWSALVVAGCGLAVGAAAVALYLPASSVARQLAAGPSRPGPSAPLAGVRKPAFGPVFEREICFAMVADLQDCFLDLDHNQFVTPPPELRRFFAKEDWIAWFLGAQRPSETSEALRAWVRASGADLLADGWQRRLTLLGGWSQGQSSDQADLIEFDRAEAEQVLQRLEPRDEAKREVADKVMRLSWLQSPGSYPSGIPGHPSWTQHDTYLFRTAAGRSGILQFIGLTQRGVRLRYKLVQEAPANPVHLSVGKTLPAMFMFQTSQGGLGILQLAGFTQNPRGVNDAGRGGCGSVLPGPRQTGAVRPEVCQTGNGLTPFDTFRPNGYLALDL